MDQVGQLQTPFRVCRLCKQQKPLLEFHAKPKGKDGRDSRCKSCISNAKLKNRIRIRAEKKKSLQRSLRKTNVIDINAFRVSRAYEFREHDALGEAMNDLIDALIAKGRNL